MFEAAVVIVVVAGAGYFIYKKMKAKSQRRIQPMDGVGGYKRDGRHLNDR